MGEYEIHRYRMIWNPHPLRHPIRRMQTWRIRRAMKRKPKVKAKRWWSCKDRRAAEMATVILRYKLDEHRKAMTHALLYGEGQIEERG